MHIGGIILQDMTATSENILEKSNGSWYWISDQKDSSL